MSTLQDPTKPAGDLVVKYGDGSALRNDGVKLKPASENPWYVLATVYGEDSKNAAQNRRIWNGWACSGLSNEERETLAKKLGLAVADLAELNSEEKKKLDEEFARRVPEFPERGGIPKPDDKIDMSNIRFANLITLRKYFFRGPAVFTSAVFEGFTNFQDVFFENSVEFGSAKFKSAAYFKETVFHGDASFGSTEFVESTFFQGAEFKDSAYFRFAKFENRADFSSVKFDDDADFHKAEFGLPMGEPERADFKDATFSGRADFDSSTFNGKADFSNGAFAGKTTFSDTKFGGDVPEFYSRRFHQNTVFTTRTANWPEVTAKNPDDSYNAYTRLSQAMNELHKPDDEHFFFRQEMRCKMLIEEKWWNRLMIWLYGGLSDYGYSVMRPVAWLALVIGFSWGIIGSYLRFGQDTPQTASIWEGLGISVSNTFPFLGFTGKMHPEFFDCAPWWLDAISGVQSIVGIVLLFFFGLGLRNRFRIK